MKNENSVIDTIKDILLIKFEFTGDIHEETMNLPLTSYYFNFTGIQLYQLLMCIEEEFNIYFKPEDISKNSFFTLAEIQKSVELKLYYGR
mgnify:CR=1 FL=1